MLRFADPERAAERGDQQRRLDRLGCTMPLGGEKPLVVSQLLPPGGRHFRRNRQGGIAKRGVDGKEQAPRALGPIGMVERR